MGGKRSKRSRLRKEVGRLAGTQAGKLRVRPSAKWRQTSCFSGGRDDTARSGSLRTRRNKYQYSVLVQSVHGKVIRIRMVAYRYHMARAERTSHKLQPTSAAPSTMAGTDAKHPSFDRLQGRKKYRQEKKARTARAGCMYVRTDSCRNGTKRVRSIALGGKRAAAKHGAELLVGTHCHCST